MLDMLTKFIANLIVCLLIYLIIKLEHIKILLDIDYFLILNEQKEEIDETEY